MGNCHRNISGGTIPYFEFQFQMDVFGVTNEHLAPGAVGDEVDGERHALFAQTPFHRRKALARKGDMIYRPCPAPCSIAVPAMPMTWTTG
jgi:hypothetical protein